MNKLNKKEPLLDVAVIGAGHAGLSISYYLVQNGLRHLVFERGKIGESWRSQRWNSFMLNTPNHVNVLPGHIDSGTDPEGFASGNEFVAILENYSSRFQLPVIEEGRVVSVEKPGGAQYFDLTVTENGSLKKYSCKQVVVASGSQNEKKIPPFAKNISPSVKQLHTLEYRNAAQLPPGAVLVTGSAQSGVQIAEDLAESGRKAYLSTSMVGRFPRRYRGKDIVDWLLKLGFFDLKTEDVTDPKIFSAKVPQVSGVGERGHTVSLQWLAGKGVTILGRAANADESNIYFNKDAPEHIKFGDEFSTNVKSMIDKFILDNHLDAPPPGADIADLPDEQASSASSLSSLNFKEHNITSIIWTTGFNGDFSYLKLPVLDSNGHPLHKNGISAIGGLYFIGLLWLRSRGSAIILGIHEDAPFIADEIMRYNGGTGTGQPH